MANSGHFELITQLMTPELFGMTPETFYKMLEVELALATKWLHKAPRDDEHEHERMQASMLKIASILQQQPDMLKRLAALDAKN